MRARGGKPLAWAGQLAGIAGKYSRVVAAYGSGAAVAVEMACDIWRLYVASERWHYRPRRLDALAADFGDFCEHSPDINPRSRYLGGPYETHIAG